MKSKNQAKLKNCSVVAYVPFQCKSLLVQISFGCFILFGKEKLICSAQYKKLSKIRNINFQIIPQTPLVHSLPAYSATQAHTAARHNTRVVTIGEQ